MSRLTRSWSAVLVVASLAFPSLCWAERTAETQPRSKVIAEGWLAPLWDALSFLVEKAGCSIDPNGCAQAADTTPPTTSVDAGCSIDPNGCAR